MILYDLCDLIRILITLVSILAPWYPHFPSFADACSSDISEENAILLFLRYPPLRLHARSIPTDSTSCASLPYLHQAHASHHSVVDLSNDNLSRRLHAHKPARTHESGTIPQLPKHPIPLSSSPLRRFRI